MLFPDSCPPLFQYNDPAIIQLEMQMFAIIGSAMAYGIVVVLFVDCCWLILKTKYIRSTQRRVCLFLYILVMTLLSTAALVQGMIYLMFGAGIFSKTIFTPASTDPGLYTKPVRFLLDLGIPMALPFSIWGANIFMVWRCLALYKEVVKEARFLVYAALLVILAASTADIVFFFLQSREIFSSIVAYFVPIPSSVVNIVLFDIILLRLFLHEEFLRRVTGLYQRVSDMFVECCTLILVTSVFHLALSALQHKGSMVTLQLLPQAISPLLVVSRLARGHGATVEQSPTQINLENARQCKRLQTIRFSDPTQTSDTSLSDIENIL